MVYFAPGRLGGALLVVDCEVAPLSPRLLNGVVTRLRELAEATRAQGVALFASKALAAEMARRGYHCEGMDRILGEGAEALALAAAVHISSGRVKLAAEVLARIV